VRHYQTGINPSQQPGSGRGTDASHGGRVDRTRSKRRWDADGSKILDRVRFAISTTVPGAPTRTPEIIEIIENVAASRGAAQSLRKLGISLSSAFLLAGKSTIASTVVVRPGKQTANRLLFDPYPRLHSDKIVIWTPCLAWENCLYGGSYHLCALDKGRPRWKGLTQLRL
jgi:hypothetical protein